MLIDLGSPLRMFTQCSNKPSGEISLQGRQRLFALLIFTGFYRLNHRIQIL